MHQSLAAENPALALLQTERYRQFSSLVDMA
jgi:hypothetical protein